MILFVTHRVTTPEHFELLREPETYTYGELQWDVNVCTDAVSHCLLEAVHSDKNPFDGRIHRGGYTD